MVYYKIRAIPEKLELLFRSHMDNVCFCINDKSMNDDGTCDIVAIPKNLKVGKLIKKNFFYIKNEMNVLGCLDCWPEYYYFPKLGNPNILGLPLLLHNKFFS